MIRKVLLSGLLLLALSNQLDAQLLDLGEIISFFLSPISFYHRIMMRRNQELAASLGETAFEAYRRNHWLALPFFIRNRYPIIDAISKRTDYDDSAYLIDGDIAVRLPRRQSDGTRMMPFENGDLPLRERGGPQQWADPISLREADLTRGELRPQLHRTNLRGFQDMEPSEGEHRHQLHHTHTRDFQDVELSEEDPRHQRQHLHSTAFRDVESSEELRHQQQQTHSTAFKDMGPSEGERRKTALHTQPSHLKGEDLENGEPRERVHRIHKTHPHGSSKIEPISEPRLSHSISVEGEEPLSGEPKGLVHQNYPIQFKDGVPSKREPRIRGMHPEVDAVPSEGGQALHTLPTQLEDGSPLGGELGPQLHQIQPSLKDGAPAVGEPRGNNIHPINPKGDGLVGGKSRHQIIDHPGMTPFGGGSSAGGNSRLPIMNGPGMTSSGGGALTGGNSRLPMIDGPGMISSGGGALTGGNSRLPIMNGPGMSSSGGGALTGGNSRLPIMNGPGMTSSGGGALTGGNSRLPMIDGPGMISSGGGSLAGGKSRSLTMNGPGMISSGGGDLPEGISRSAIMDRPGMVYSGGNLGDGKSRRLIIEGPQMITFEGEDKIKGQPRRLIIDSPQMIASEDGEIQDGKARRLIIERPQMIAFEGGENLQLRHKRQIEKELLENLEGHENGRDIFFQKPMQLFSELNMLSNPVENMRHIFSDSRNIPGDIRRGTEQVRTSVRKVITQ